MSTQISAMRERHVQVAVVCTCKRYVVMDNGLVLPIYGFLDGDREPCEPEEAWYYEFGDEEHGFGTGDYAAYDMPSWEHH